MRTGNRVHADLGGGISGERYGGRPRLILTFAALLAACSSGSQQAEMNATPYEPGSTRAESELDSKLLPANVGELQTPMSALRVSADFEALERNRGTKKFQIPVTVEGRFGGQEVRWAGVIGPRGHSTKDHCEHAPFWFLAAATGTPFGTERVKVLRHCGRWSGDGPEADTTDWIRRQILVHAVFQLLLGERRALKTWPAKLEYHQSADARRLEVGADAFFLESPEAFAARTTSTVVSKKETNITLDATAVVNGLIVAFVTGAHDLSVTNGGWQNVELVRTDGLVVPLFYDFDEAATVRGKLDPWEDEVLHGWCQDWTVDVAAAASALSAKWATGVRDFQEREAQEAPVGISDQAQHVVSRYVTKRFAWLSRVLGDPTRRRAFLDQCSKAFCAGTRKDESCPELNLPTSH